MSRKIGTSARARSHGLQKPQPGKSENRQGPVAAKSDIRRKTSTENPAPAITRPPPPGEGKRGEQGYLAYLLRQAQGATRLAMERSLADLGVTTPQFVVLTMLRAYPGLSGADLARVAMLTAQTVGVLNGTLNADCRMNNDPHHTHT